jgi:hypothetical protein
VFPKTRVENEFPHMTLMISNGWKPLDSNSILQATCSKGGAFEKAYNIVKEGTALNEPSVITAEDVLIGKKCTVGEVVFVDLGKPIKFNGFTEAFN